MEQLSRNFVSLPALCLPVQRCSSAGHLYLRRQWRRHTWPWWVVIFIFHGQAGRTEILLCWAYQPEYVENLMAFLPACLTEYITSSTMPRISRVVSGALTQVKTPMLMVTGQSCACIPVRISDWIFERMVWPVTI